MKFSDALTIVLVIAAMVFVWSFCKSESSKARNGEYPKGTFMHGVTKLIAGGLALKGAYDLVKNGQGSTGTNASSDGGQRGFSQPTGGHSVTGKSGREYYVPNSANTKNDKGFVSDFVEFMASRHAKR